MSVLFLRVRFGRWNVSISVELVKIILLDLVNDVTAELVGVWQVFIILVSD